MAGLFASLRALWKQERKALTRGNRRRPAFETLEERATPAVVGVAIDSPTAGEDDGTRLVYTFTRESDDDGAVTINFSVAGGAVLNDDYIIIGEDSFDGVNGTVTIPELSTSAIVSFAPLSDDLVEGDETIDVTIEAGDYENDSPTATGTIVDADTADLSVQAYDGAEGAVPTNGQFVVSLSQPSSTDTTVNYTISGSADAGNDYTHLSGSVLIPAGETSATVDVEVIDDALLELTETVDLAIDSIAGDSDISFATDPVSLSILDDDLTTVTVTANGDAVEPDQNGHFLFTLAQPSPTDTVVFVDVSGSAESGVDFIELPTSITIPAGETQYDLVVETLDDDVVEGAKDLHIVITGTDSAVVGFDATEAAINIVDDDVAVVSIFGSRNAAEPDGEGSFTIVMSKPSVFDTVVFYSITAEGTATRDVDFTAPGEDYVVIPAGETFASITITPIDDDVIEGTETVVVSLDGTLSQSFEPGHDLPVEREAAVEIDAVDNTAFVTITDDETLSVAVSWNFDGYEASFEGVHSFGQFLITLSTTSATDTIVHFTIGGDAEADSDYQAVSGIAVIPAGEFSTTVDVDVIDDPLVELDETVTITLDSVDGAEIDPFSFEASLTIVSDDVATVAITRADDAAEPGTNGRFLVTLSAASSTDTVISYSTSDPEGDFETLPLEITIPAGETTAEIVVAVLDDDIIEPNEAVTVTLTDTNHPHIGVDPDFGAVTVEIVDDDVATVTVEQVEDAGESSGAGTFRVSLSKASSTPTVITYQLGGTASESDYVHSSPAISELGTLVIPAGETSALITITPIDDAESEGNETVVLNLLEITSGDSDITLSDETEAALTIADNDAFLQVTINEAFDPVTAGRTLGLYTVTIANLGLTDATGVMVTLDFILPAGVTVSGTSDAGNVSGGGTSFVWAAGGIAASSQNQLIISIALAGSTEPDSTINITATVSEADQSVANQDPASETTTTTPPPPSGTISGRVYRDHNGDSDRDDGEEGLPGRRVYIDANEDGAFQDTETSTLTDSNGDYSLPGEALGSHVIRVALFPIDASTDGGRDIELDSASVPDIDLGIRQNSINVFTPIVVALFTDNSPTDNEQIVEAIYLSILNRSSDPIGKPFWLDKLNSGASVLDVVRGFKRSEEYAKLLINQLYGALLDRKADAVGLARWAAVMQDVTVPNPTELVIESVMSSREFADKTPTQASFVDELYHRILGREPDVSAQRWVLDLESGALTREAVIRGFLDSEEARLRLIRASYDTYYNRAGETSSIPEWLTFIAAHSTSPTEFIAQFLNATEFRERATAGVG